jgi:hypothetical protein
VVKNAPRRKIAEIDALFSALRSVFEKPQVNKADIVEILKDYLPNFSHIETGKSLDQKM